MAKKHSTDESTKPKANPLGGIGRKPGSYIGDLDSLLAEVGESGDETSREASGSHPKVEDGPRSDETQRTRRAKTTTKRINLDVPTDLHQRFKGATSMAGRTMTEVLQELIREYLGERRA